MTKETLAKAKRLESDINTYQNDIANIEITLKENEDVYLNGPYCLGKLPDEFKQPLLEMLKGYYQAIIDKKEKELEEL